MADFNAWMNSADPTDPANNPVNPNVRSAVYCTAAREGPFGTVSFISDMATATFNPQEKIALNEAITCGVIDPDLPKKLL